MTISNKRPKHNSIEASPKIKKVIDRQVMSSIMVPTTPKSTYKKTHASSESKTREKKPVGTIKNPKKQKKKTVFKKTKMLNILFKS